MKKEKANKRETLGDVRAEVSINANSNKADDVVKINSVTRKTHSLDPMDQFARSISPSENRRQLKAKESSFKRRTNEVHTYLARWVYELGIPFNSINNDAFCQFVEAVGQFGPG